MKKYSKKYPELSITNGYKYLSYKTNIGQPLYSISKAACHSEVFKSTWVDIKKSVFYHEIQEKYSDTDLRTWASFMNACGFPCYYTKNKNKKYIKLSGRDYISKVHFLVGITSIRYINYTYNSSYIYIPNISIRIYNNTTFSPYESFILGHFFAMKQIGYWDSAHGLLKGIGTVLPEKEVKKRYLTRVCVNDCFSSSSVAVSNLMPTLLNLYSSGKFHELEKEIIKNKIVVRSK